MNEDKLQIGDLVTHRFGQSTDIGLVVAFDDRVADAHLKLYWLQLGRMGWAWEIDLTKLKPDHKKKKMNKDKLQVGDLVTYRKVVGFDEIGLVVSQTSRWDTAKIHWFKSGKILRVSSLNLTNLSPTQEEQNE